MNTNIQIPLNLFKQVRCSCKVITHDAFGEIIDNVCGCETFRHVTRVMRYEGILSSQPVIVQQPAIQCTDCGHIMPME